MLHEAIACFILAQTEGFEQSSGEAPLRVTINNWYLLAIIFKEEKQTGRICQSLETPVPDLI